MQMSRERFQAVHKLIWDTVIVHTLEVRDRKKSVYFLKGVGLDKAYEKGLLDLDETLMIDYHNRCLLCALYGFCDLCPLEYCNNKDSLFKKACKGDVEAMMEIRDVVDKPPFTELSVINFYGGY